MMYHYVVATVSRRCIRDDEWDEAVNCFREQTGILLDKVMMYFSCQKSLVIISGYKSY